MKNLMIMDNNTLALASTLSTVIEGTLYGLSLSMYYCTMRFLLMKRKRQGVNRVVVMVGCCLFSLSSAHLVINVYRLLEGLAVTLQATDPGQDFSELHLGRTVEFFEDVAHPTFVAKTVLYTAQTLVLDGFFIYRAFVVWHAWWVPLVLTFGWLGLAGLTVVANLSLARTATEAEDPFTTQTGSWVVAIYCITLVTNLAATTLLAYRIWSTQRQISKIRDKSTTDVKSESTGTGCDSPLELGTLLLFVAESGAVYSFTILAGLVTLVLNSPGAYVLFDMISPVISIAFNVIPVRVGFAREEHNLLHQTRSGTLHFDKEETGGRSSPDGASISGQNPKRRLLDDVRWPVTQVKGFVSELVSVKNSEVAEEGGDKGEGGSKRCHTGSWDPESQLPTPPLSRPPPHASRRA